MPMATLIVNLLFSGLLSFSGQRVSAQTLNSSLPSNQLACPDEQITFTCKIQANSQAGLALAWSSDYIGAQIQFAASRDSPGLRREPNNNAVVEFTALRNESDGSVSLISTLNITVVSGRIPSVTCTDIGTGASTMNSFTVLDGIIIVISIMHWLDAVDWEIFVKKFLLLA